MRYFAPLLIVLAVALGAPVAAQPFGNGGGQQMQSLDSILSNIRRQHPGQLSDVQGPNNGRYLIKWLTPDGRVLWLETDARTGQILGVRGGGEGDAALGRPAQEHLFFVLFLFSSRFFPVSSSTAKDTMEATKV